MRSRWPGGSADPSARSCTGIAAPNGCAGAGSGRQGCSAPWDPSPPASTTRSSSRSGQPCSASCSTAQHGTRGRSSHPPCSNGSRASITRRDDTARRATSPRRIRNPSHDHPRRGMIGTENVSGRPAQAPSAVSGPRATHCDADWDSSSSTPEPRRPGAHAPTLASIPHRRSQPHRLARQRLTPRPMAGASVCDR